MTTARLEKCIHFEEAMKINIIVQKKGMSDNEWFLNEGEDTISPEESEKDYMTHHSSRDAKRARIEEICPQCKDVAICDAKYTYGVT